jgi:hypothetical protein
MLEAISRRELQSKSTPSSKTFTAEQIFWDKENPTGRALVNKMLEVGQPVDVRPASGDKIFPPTLYTIGDNADGLTVFVSPDYPKFYTIHEPTKVTNVPGEATTIASFSGIDSHKDPELLAKTMVDTIEGHVKALRNPLFTD